MTESHSLNVLLAFVAVVFLAVAVLLLVDRVKKHRDGVGLAILEDRPGTDEQFAEWNREDR
ncbi:hypothetical protein [Amycolatopsis palatopharyngis]|uniref:hypothetical protein n=1 Tax=Amycolatopsis palatopharyngis TaxID=187982 RepID=UPI000E2341EA|nr:hypothetical protein [Amycolatopsis palatopharyngis]